MTESWLPIPRIRAVADGGVEADLAIPLDSPWFVGHFPGRPILPGVTWLAAIADLVRRDGVQAGRPVEVVGFRNVRFKRQVEGAARALLVVAPVDAGKPGELKFEVRLAGETICHGLIAVRPPGAPDGTPVADPP